LHLFLLCFYVGYIPSKLEESIDIFLYGELPQLKFIEFFILFIEIFFRQILLPEVFLKPFLRQVFFVNPFYILKVFPPNGSLSIQVEGGYSDLQVF